MTPFPAYFNSDWPNNDDLQKYILALLYKILIYNLIACYFKFEVVLQTQISYIFICLYKLCIKNDQKVSVLYIDVNMHSLHIIQYTIVNKGPIFEIYYMSLFLTS
jgi:hypothetical protein